MTDRIQTGLTLAALGLSLLAGNPSAVAKGSVSIFEHDVLPILNSHCLGCHGGLHKKGGLDLRTAASAIAGGDSGMVWAN